MRTIIKQTTLDELFNVKKVEKWLDHNDYDEWGRCEQWKFEMVELEPSVRTLKFSLDEDECDWPSKQTYAWHLPYLQFLFSDPWLGVGASTKPFKLGKKLRMSPLPNIYESGLVCQEETHSIEDAIATFFGSTFESPGSWWPCRWFARIAFDYINDFQDSVFCYKMAELGEDILKVNWKDMETLGEDSFYNYPEKKWTTILPFLHHAITDEEFS
jgi:hypothetical protein